MRAPQLSKGVASIQCSVSQSPGRKLDRTHLTASPSGSGFDEAPVAFVGFVGVGCFILSDNFFMLSPAILSRGPTADESPAC